MIERYTRPEMGRIWELENKYAKWLEVEVAVCHAWAELGEIPLEAAREIEARARIDVDRILELEAEIHHDIVAFTTSIAEQVGDSAKYLHYGLTSTDVVDTAQALQLVETVDLLLKDIDQLLETLRRQAVAHKKTLMIGRTHGVHAEPMTLGLKFAIWLEEMKRNRDRLVQARSRIAVGKISGSVGTYANVSPQVEEFVCRRLGLEPAPVSSQVLQRDRHAELMTVMAICGGTLEKIATEIRGLQKTEVRELEEPFRKGQKGSSSMPHKRNPEKCERVAGLARVLRGNALAALEDQTLWHERDISHSSVERIILPDSAILLDYCLHMMNTILTDLHVYPENMKRNLEKTGGLIFSQRVLLALVDSGLSREDAYAIVQGHAMQAWQTGEDFRERIRRDERVTSRLSEEKLADCFDYRYHLRHIDRIYRRLGLEEAFND